MRTLIFVLFFAFLVGRVGVECRSAVAALPPEWLDDADLGSIAFADPTHGWACGDRGVVWYTADGGATWRRQSSGVDCRLYCVQFLDAQNGWLVGGGYEPYTHRSRGVVLRTVDGGASWRPEAAALVPLLRKIHMLDGREGWAVGEASELSPAGVYFTRDGGKTWSGAGGRRPAGIVAADMSSPLEGACADGRGRVVRLENRMLQATPIAEFGLRTVRDLVLRGGAPSWLVGDGGLVRMSSDGGRSWHAPGHDFTQGPASQCDWHAAAVHGAQAWIVGAPGSVVLHTPDGGANWRLLPTDQTLPLYDATFLDERRGFAVGALGLILATDDAGTTWRRVSREPHRAALWACFADAASLPAELVAHAAAEDGFRTAVTLLGRRDVEPGVDDGPPGVDRRLAAVSTLGAAGAEQAWAFPLRQAPLETSAEQLLEAWGEGDPEAGLRLAEARLVRTLRMWRPEVVLTHAPAPRGNAPTTHFLHQLVLEAVEAAGDPAQYPEQLEFLGLAPWQPRKVFGFDPEQKTGSLVLPREHVMFRTAQSLDDFCERYRGLVHSEPRLRQNASACKLVWNRTAAAAAPREFFAGIDLPIGGDARRAMPSENAEQRVRMRRSAERQSHLEAVVLQRSGIVGAGLVDQIRAVTAGLEDGPAGDTVFQLAEAFRMRGRWEAARETYEYLAARYPRHPAAEAALRRAVQYLSSAEADHRLRRTLDDLGPRPATPQVSAAARDAHDFVTTGIGALSSVREPATTTLAQQTAAAAPQAERFEQLNISMAPSAPTITAAPTVATPAARLLGTEPNAPLAGASGQGAAATSGPVVEATLVGATEPVDRRRRALGLGMLLEQRDPTMHNVPEVSFPLAAARRLLGQTAEAEAFYERFVSSQGEGPWQDAAIDELALARRTAPRRRTATAAQAGERPLLDGRLDDAVWRTAAPLELRSPLGDDASWPAAVWIAADDEYLYLAVRAERTGRAPPLGSEVRQRDADLRAFDRLEFYFDVDRDYATYYRLAIDCRGWTHESCWSDATWDPKWFVAAGGDERTWTAEAAVPWRELVARKPAAGETWAVGIQRIAPLTGLQTWTLPAAAEVRPEGFGYLTFP